MFSRLLSKFGLIKATIITTLMVAAISVVIACVVNILIGRQITLQTFLVASLLPFFVAPLFIYSHFSLLLKLVGSEQMSKEQAADYKNLINNIPGVVYRGHPDWTTEIISESKEICGYTEKEINLFEKGWQEVIHSEDIKAIMGESNISLPGENSLVQTYRIISKNSDIKWVQDRKRSFFSHDGEFLGVEGIIFDITEQHKMEEGLLKVKKLESVGVLAGGIAHDFNNILAAILGNINLALYDAEMPAKTKKLLSEAEKASIRAKDLTQQLLTFSKGGDPVKEVSSLERVIKDSASFVLHGDKVACRYDIPEDLWLVDIDKGQISQVIQNLVLNGSYAMSEGGIIRVNCDNLASIGKDALPFAKEGRFVKISIQDSGIGMSANVAEKIFDPYFSTKHGGSGLGLAITQSIINKHNGHISVESSLGVGSTFTIYLPSSEKTKTQKQKSYVADRTASQAKILVMDDDEMVRTIAQEMLMQLGHEVVLAADGEAAVKLYQETMESDERFDLVVMDLTIPGGMGGEEAVQEILNIDPEAKVIVSSGYSTNPIMAKFKNYGFCSAIAKPYQLQEFSGVISQFLD